MSQTENAQPNGFEGPTLAGHPTGLFALFFAEMWERFSYYGMRALLVFYMLKGFLSYNDADAYRVYGAYVALVYMTPFFGGLIADRLLGARRAVVLGGLLMAGGHLLMTWENATAFFGALALLIVGNGFFKPNISTIVGSLYPAGSSQRDGGFTIFYMGINLGAAMAPLLCGYVGETYGWHYGFGLATLGMLVGLAVFVVPANLARILILAGALATSTAMVALQDSTLLLIVNGFVAAALVVSGALAFAALGRGGLSVEAGGAPDEEKLRQPMFLGISAEWCVYLASLAVVPVLAFLVASNRSTTLIAQETLHGMTSSDSPLVSLAGTLAREVSTPTGLILAITGVVAFAYLAREAFRVTLRERQRIYVVGILLFFNMLFWAFFEQAGSSISNFTDRNIDRVAEERVLTEEDVGSTVNITLNQEQFGHIIDGKMFTVDQYAERQKSGDLDVSLDVMDHHIGMGINGNEIPASVFQSANPIYIVLFGLLFSALWRQLALRGREPTTPIKFALGLIQLGLGFGAMWYGAVTHDPRGMVGMEWLLLGYLLLTTGELCESPVGLSMVTKLSPTHLVSTMMGAWFLSTAFSNYLSAVIAVFTGVSHGGDDNAVPPPIETVSVYGGVFQQIAFIAIGSAFVLVLLAPTLTRWMRADDADEVAQPTGA